MPKDKPLIAAYSNSFSPCRCTNGKRVVWAEKDIIRRQYRVKLGPRRVRSDISSKRLAAGLFAKRSQKPETDRFKEPVGTAERIGLLWHDRRT